MTLLAWSLRSYAPYMFLFLITACDVLQPYLEEVREETTEVVYAGTVLEGPPASENPNFTDGVLAFTVDGQTEPVLASQPFAENPGYWRVTLPPGEGFTLRVEGSQEDSYPAVWRGRSPEETGLWYTGAVFSWPHSTVDPFFESLAESLDIEIGDLKEDPVVHLWGLVSNPEDASRADWPYEMETESVWQWFRAT